MTGVVPNNPPVLRYRYGVSSSKHDLVGSNISTISVFTPLLDGKPVATKYLITSKEKIFLKYYVGIVKSQNLLGETSQIPSDIQISDFGTKF